MSEDDFAAEQEALEQSRLFSLLKTAGVIHLSEFPRARFAAKQFAGYGMKLSSGSGLPELLDGESEIVRLIQSVGQEKFEKCFLKSDDDLKASEECDLTLKQVKQIRDLIDKVYIQTEFEQTSVEPITQPAKVYSAVAGISVENGKPILAFFHREIWKGRYSVNQEKLLEYQQGVSSDESRKAESVISKLKFLERRKTTLYRLLELLMERQADYFVSGKPEKRKPVTQRELARQLEVGASVLNRLVSNKSIQLPWGLEAPLSALILSAKQINKELLYQIIKAAPGFTDEQLRREMGYRHNVKLSRRSIAQYRKELTKKRGCRKAPK